MENSPPDDFEIETTFISANDPHPLVGWKIYTQDFGQTHDDMLRQIYEDNPEGYEQAVFDEAVDRASETDWSDEQSVVDHEYGIGYISIDMLEFLWGLPWNNLARSYVSALRPSNIRVTTGTIKLDAMPWRVTVFLEDDRRTICKIRQEVQVSLRGAWDGSDLRNQLDYERENGSLDGYDRGDGLPQVYINPDCWIR